MIKLEQVSKKIDRKLILDKVSLTIPRNQIVSLQGSNGAGKSTLIKVICGLYQPTSGKVIFESQLTTFEIGYLTQSFSMYEDLTVYENACFFAEIYGLSMTKAGILAHLERLKMRPYLDVLAGDLSGGWQQKLGLLCATIHHPKLVILDEPTAGVDLVARQDIWAYIQELKSEGVTVIVTTHYADEIIFCDEVVFLHEGRILLEILPPNLLLEHYGYHSFETLFYDAVKGAL